MRGAAKFMIALAVTCASALAAVAAINYSVDVNGVYSSEADYWAHVNRYVDALLQSEHGLAYIPFDRGVKFELARRTAADCYVLGSSHEIQINARRFPLLGERCRQIINLGVSGGVYEDVLTFLSVLADKPAGTHAYIGLRPWFFGPPVNDQWGEIGNQYALARAKFGLRRNRARPSFRLAANLINADYLERNLEKLVGAAGSGPPENPADWRHETANPNVGMTDRDGSLTYPPESGNAATPEPAFGPGILTIREPFVVPAVVHEFETVILALRARGIEIHIMLMPFRPDTLECPDPLLCRAFEQTETVAHDLGRRLGVEVIGGYDSRRYGLTRDDFRDYHHLAEKAFPKLSAALKAEAASK